MLRRGIWKDGLGRLGRVARMAAMSARHRRRSQRATLAVGQKRISRAGSRQAALSPREDPEWSVLWNDCCGQAVHVMEPAPESRQFEPAMFCTDHYSGLPRTP